MNIETNVGSRWSADVADEFDEGVRLEEIFARYTKAYVFELRSRVPDARGDAQDEEIAKIFDEVAPVLSELQISLDAGHLDRATLSKVTKTATLLNNLVEGLMAARQGNWH